MMSVAASCASNPGPFCASVGVSDDHLLENKLENLPKLHSPEKLVNGLIYELGEFRNKYGIGWHFVFQWILVLCDSFLNLTTATFNETNLKASIQRLVKKVKTMKRKARKS